MNVLLGSGTMAIGILGLTGLMPMFTTNPAYLNLIEMGAGLMGLLVGLSGLSRNEIYHNRLKNLSEYYRKESDQRGNDII